MSKVIIALNGQTTEEIEKVYGVIHGIPWDALIPTISEHVRLRPDELIEGLIVDDATVKVKIGRKRGRKVKA